MLNDVLPNFTANFAYIFTGVCVALISNFTLVMLAVINHRDVRETKRKIDTGNGRTLGETVYDLKNRLEDHMIEDHDQFIEIKDRIRKRRWF